MTRLATVLILLAVSEGACHWCVKPSAASPAWQDANSFNRGSLATALATRHLRPVSIDNRTLTPDGPRRKVGESWTETLDGGRVATLVAGPTVFDSDPRPPAMFGADDSGDLWLLDVQRKVVASRSFVYCGCNPNVRGMPPRALQIVFVLPERARYRGTIAVEHEAKEVVELWDGRDANGSPCGAPP